jgi:hypothetical protein
LYCQAALVESNRGNGFDWGFVFPQRRGPSDVVHMQPDRIRDLVQSTKVFGEVFLIGFIQAPDQITQHCVGQIERLGDQRHLILKFASGVVSV